MGSDTMTEAHAIFVSISPIFTQPYIERTPIICGNTFDIQLLASFDCGSERHDPLEVQGVSVGYIHMDSPTMKHSSFKSHE